MAATHFEILKLPNSIYVNSLIGGLPLEENTLYEINLEQSVSFERVNDLDGLAVFGSLEYRTYDEVKDVYSNKAIVNLKWRTPNASLIPDSNNATIQMNNGEEIKLIDVLPLNEAVEFIDITAISGVKNLKFYNLNFSTGRIKVQDLHKAFFKVNNKGGGPEYFKMFYSVGKELGDAAISIFDLIVSVDTIAELKLNTNIDEDIDNYTDTFDVNGVATEYNVKEQYNRVMITDGFSNGLASVELAINSAFLSLNDWNSVIIQIDGEQHEFFENGVHRLSTKLNVFGHADITLVNKMIENIPNPKLGSLIIKLLTINGDASVVSSTFNEVPISTNL